MAAFGSPNFFFGAGVFLFVLFFMVKSDDTCDLEIENTLRNLLAPHEYPSIQLQALRKDILRRLQEALDKIDENDDNNYYRSLNSLQRNSLSEKRNLEALARAGYVRTAPKDDEEDLSYKRSIADLAKNGQLPTYQNNDSKRGIESLARNGELRHRKEIQELLEELYNKRNIGSLPRNFNLPYYNKRFLGSLAKSGNLPYAEKRNIAALARDGAIISGKRNVAALLRQDNYLNGHSNDAGTEIPQANEEKRNIASVKAQYPAAYRNKRQASYYEGESEEYPSPVYQNQNGFDYEELVKVLTGEYPETQKRFLGRLPQMGKPKTTQSPKTRFH